MPCLGSSARQTWSSASSTQTGRRCPLCSSRGACTPTPSLGKLNSPSGHRRKRRRRRRRRRRRPGHERAARRGPPSVTAAALGSCRVGDLRSAADANTTSSNVEEWGCVFVSSVPHLRTHANLARMRRYESSPPRAPFPGCPTWPAARPGAISGRGGNQLRR
eukprot:scaffold270_cov390-Prasinococcus_capsulatus_cf.AAC.15